MHGIDRGRARRGIRCDCGVDGGQRLGGAEVARDGRADDPDDGVVPGAGRVECGHRRRPGAPRREARLGLGQGVCGPLPVGAVVVGQEGKPDRSGVRTTGEQLRHEHEVSERLAHLLALVGHHPGMRVDARERLARECRRVCGTELVMGEKQVGATSLHGDGRPDAVERDDGALDVPAGPSAPEHRLPCRLALTSGPPEKRIQRVPLALPVGVSPALAEELEHRLAAEVAFEA